MNILMGMGHGSLFILVTGVLSLALFLIGTPNVFAGTNSITGVVFEDLDGNGIQDGGEPGIGFVEVCVDDGTFAEGEFAEEFTGFLQPAFAGFISEELGFCVSTLGDGSYSIFPGIAGPHTVYAIPPFGLIPTGNLFQLVDTTGGPESGIDFGFFDPPGLDPAVDIGPLNSFTIDGLPTVYWQNELTISKTVDGSDGNFNHCGVEPVESMTLTLGPFSEPENTFIPTEIVSMELSSLSPEIWTAVVDPLFPNHGTAQLRFDITCPTLPVEFQIGGYIYIDPSGFVRSICDGSPIEEAEVSLFKFDAFFDGYLPASDFFPIPYFPDIGDMQDTDAFGQYGWNTMPGDYRVDVDAFDEGFEDASLFVTVVDVPVLDANFLLTPFVGCQVGGTILPIDSTALLLAGAQGTASWLIPVLVTAIGIGIFFVSRKSK